MNTYLQAITDKISRHETFRIVFLGDSLTSTEWIQPNWREIVEYVLKEELEKLGDWKLASWGIRCYNAGFDGSTTANWLEKLDDEVLTLKPDMVIVMGGSNDWLFHITPETSQQNLTALFNRLHAVGVSHVIYATPQHFGGDHDIERCKVIAQAAAELFPRENVLFVNLFELFSQFELKRFYSFRQKEDFLPAGIKAGDLDTTHPNRVGQAYTAKVFLKQVFGLDFDPEIYLQDVYADNVKYPRYKA